jgi:hypothetical protein
MATPESGKKHFRENLAKANWAGRLAARIEPRAAKAVYVARAAALNIELTSGITIILPLSRIPELKGATTRQIREIEVLGRGSGLRWEALDLDYGVPNLIASLFDPGWMAEMGRLGSSESAAPKTKRARKNARKIVRPGTQVSHAGAARR